MKLKTPFIFITNGQLAFFIVVPTVILIVLGFALYFVLRSRMMKKDFKYFYYKRLYRLAMDKDYYLINNFIFKIDDSHVGRIDHILFGDKYIYLINDSYFDGDIEGKENDRSLILINKVGKKYYVDNPIIDNRNILTKLAIVTGIDKSLLISISLINDNCHSGVITSSNSSYIIQSNKMKYLIKAIESRPIGKINAKELANAVKAIDKLNRRKRNANVKENH